MLTPGAAQTATPTPGIGPASATPATLTPTSATTPHPLPPKPAAFSGQAAGSYSPRTGAKRMGSPIPTVDQKLKTGFSWNTGDPIFSVKIKGEGDTGVRTITFNSDGTQFAVACKCGSLFSGSFRLSVECVGYDKTVRIWDRRTRQEKAKLGHNMQVLAVAWMDHDSGVITLGDNGILSAWTRNVSFSLFTRSSLSDSCEY